MSSHLTRGKLNIGLVQEKARKELLDLLDKCDGTKTIVWDEGLSGPFGLISEYSLLRNRDVVKMHPLRPGKLHSVDTDNVIFITRSQIKLMNYVAENIHGEENTSGKKSKQMKRWHIFFVPLKSLLCTEHLKNKGVYGSFTTVEQMPHCSVFPIDNDVLSMEIEDGFKEYYIDNDPTCLFQIANTLLLLQDTYGPIRRVYGKGDSAMRVWKLMNKLSKESQNLKADISKQKSINCQIDQLLLLDRSIDLISPLATQITYEGLIDELYGINNCTVKLPYEKFANKEELNDNVPEKKSIILNSADEIYTELRDVNLTDVCKILTRKTKQMSSQLDERHNEKSLQEMKQFVAKLPQLLAVKKCLATHLTIAEMIKEQIDNEKFMGDLRMEHDIILGIDTDKVNSRIEDCMANKADLVKILRLICIQSAVNSGLKPKVLEHYKRAVIQAYGFQHILTFNNLEKAGLIKIQQGSRSFTVLRKTLKLTTEEPLDSTPVDITYVHGVYAPLTVRLTQYFAKSGSWRSLSDVISILPGALLDQSVSQLSVASSALSGSSLTQRSKLFLCGTLLTLEYTLHLMN